MQATAPVTITGASTPPSSIGLIDGNDVLGIIPVNPADNICTLR